MVIKLHIELCPDQKVTLIDFRSHRVKGQVHSDLECENVSSDNSTMPAPMALKLDLEVGPDQLLTPIVFGAHRVKGQGHNDL